MSWEMVKIEDYLFFQEGPGVRNSQFTTSGVKLLNVGNINNGNLNLEATKIFISEEEANVKYKHFLVEDGDLLIASSGIVVDNFHNKITWAKKEHLPLCMNTSTIRFRSLNSNLLDIKYFSYFLKTRIFSEQLRKLITGSAQLNFGPSHLKQIYFPLPPLATQKRIAEILDKADALRRKDQELLKKYDDLAQAIFIDMFGDPVKNEKGWEVKKCSDLFDMKLGKMLSAKNYVGTHLKKYLRNVNVQWGKIDISDTNEMDFFDNEIEKYLLKKGDILVCEGGEVGRTAIFELEEEFYYQNALHRLRQKKLNEINSTFFEYYMLIAVKKGLIDKLTISVTIKHFTLEKFKELEIIVPSYKLQILFEKRIKNIKDQLIKIKNVNLFDSLLQKAFKGELN